MKIRVKSIFKFAGYGLLLLLAAGIAAPYLSADRYGERLRVSLERALGGNHRVEIGKVRFSLFKGPGFSLERVTIHEDPSIGLEPIVYIPETGSLEVAPRLWSLLGGRFEVASIRLDGARINLSKSGPASEWGRWNFAAVVKRSIMSATPAIHVRDSRINFKFGDAKSVLYLTETDLDISPPSPGGSGWSVKCSARPARTDRAAQGLGAFTLKGRWYVAPERVDMDLELEKSGLDEITTLIRGHAGGVHGKISSLVHLAGPLDNIGISGRLNIEDIHRWDMLPPKGDGWPLDIRGKLDLLGQKFELESNSARNAPLPVWVRFRATDYLTQPRWAVGVNWNKFPVEPIMELARHMGAQIPPALKLSGTMDGAIGNSGQGIQGEVAFRDAALTIPDSPPVRFEHASIIFDQGHARLAPAAVRTADGEEASLEADYDLAAGSLDLSIAAKDVGVPALRAQVALAAVPWLEQVRSGTWSGTLRYRSDAGADGWAGKLEVKDAEVDVPGLASPLRIMQARAQIDGARVDLDRMQAVLGKVGFTGEYHYAPGAPRPHRVRLRAAEVDAAELENEMMPTLRRAGLLARALGRAAVPPWLRERAVEGAIQIDGMTLGRWHFQDIRTRLLWDGARVRLEGLQARLDEADVTGRLSVNLRGARPFYTLAAHVHGLEWQGGRIDAEGALETFGAGSQLLANLSSEGAFTGAGVEFESAEPLRALTGRYNLEWWQEAPRLRFTGLNVRTDAEAYTGRGATQEDGRLVVVLSNGSREMRFSGTLAKLQPDLVAR